MPLTSTTTVSATTGMSLTSGALSIEIDDSVPIAYAGIGTNTVFSLFQGISPKK